MDQITIEVEFYCPVPGKGNLPVLQAAETITASTESEVFRKIHMRNSVLQYVNNAYWRIKDESIRKKYFDWTSFVYHDLKYPFEQEGLFIYLDKTN
jgi:hypothetical protein